MKYAHRIVCLLILLAIVGSTPTVCFTAEPSATAENAKPKNKPNKAAKRRPAGRPTDAQPGDIATNPQGLQAPDNFHVELLYTVPSETQGSWVSMTLDDKGRLITCDQYGGLYRIDPPPVGHVLRGQEIEPLDVEIGGVQGMVWVGYSLYVVVNGRAAQGPGLYRLDDTDSDDRLDSVTLLKKFKAKSPGTEHGPHGIVLGPDNKSLYIVAGNMTAVPDGVAQPARCAHWGEDQLLKRNPSSTGHASGIMAPAGWVCRTDLKGEAWELIATGFRNPYDLAFNRDGELFTYDADMEHDTGAPWYRPTRVCHVFSGAEFGWRFGTGKFPPYYPDSRPAAVDVGLGSPTGIAFGYAARFPSEYQDALFVCDWTYGRMLAVHLTPDGASYSGRVEPFISGTPLPLTDVVVSPTDKAMYFTTGGRRTQSGLYRVTYTGVAGAGGRTSTEQELAAHAQRQVRRELEALHGTSSDGTSSEAAIEMAWPRLASEDAAIRFAARVAVEHRPVDAWFQRAVDEQQPDAALQALLALARCGESGQQASLLAALDHLDWKLLDMRQRIALLRVYGLSFIRQGAPNDATKQRLAQKFATLFPAASRPVNHELCKLLVYLDAPQVVRKSLELLAQAPTQEDALTYAMALRLAKNGWTDDLRRQYFQWLNTAEERSATGEFMGGGHMQAFIWQMRDDAKKSLDDEEREKLAAVIEPPIERLQPPGSPTPRRFVRNWKQEDLADDLEQIGAGQTFAIGERLFVEAGCRTCHRFANRGGIFGPDLTGAAKRFSRPIMLREIMQPSHVISDQYRTYQFQTVEGRVYEGRILNETDDAVTVATDPRQPTHRVVLAKQNIEARKPSEASLMPVDLLNTLSRQEILELLAYIESGGDRQAAVYAGDKSVRETTDTPPATTQSAPARPATAQSDRPPNVVMIISDDQAWTDYGFMGHDDIETPALDKLAAQSATFTRGYVPTALCRPSLMTLLTGLYAHQHKTTGNDPTPPPGVPMSRRNEEYLALCERLIAHVQQHPTLPRLLGRQGYVSFQSGKWWEGAPARGGFTAGMTTGDPARGGRHGDAGLRIGRQGMQPVFDFIDGADEKPFFLWYAPFLPHTPHTPPPRLLNKHKQPGRPIELAKYYAMCEWFDETCGQLLDYLDENNLSENTLVVYVCDNGWIQFTSKTEAPGNWGKGFAPRSKQSVYEGGVRTPIMLRWPGKIEPKLDRQTLVSSIDLAPTILAACGQAATKEMPGIDLLPVCAGKSPGREQIFGEGFAHDVADVDNPAASLLFRWTIADRWKLILTANGTAGRYKHIHDRSTPVQLFDVIADPHETKNVADEHADVVERMTKALNNWWQPTSTE